MRKGKGRKKRNKRDKPKEFITKKERKLPGYKASRYEGKDRDKE